jgi:TolB-like protein/Flp pilus assembly protein TadD
MQTNFPQGLWHLGNILIATGPHEEAVATLRHATELLPRSPMILYILAFALSENGQVDEARRIADDLAANPETKAFFTAMAYVAARDFDKAFEYFEKAVEEKNEWLIWFGVEPKLDPIRSDPRYLNILRDSNNPVVDDTNRSEDIIFDTDERIRSIAVLPFKVIGGSTDPSGDQFLSLGLADAVTMRLSNIGRFLVRPTSSVLSYANVDTDPFKAGRELGVKFIVDGIIRQVGDSIRVTVQLLDVEDSGTYWAASFDEKFTDVLELEDLISDRVIRSLLPKISGEEEQRIAKRGTQNAAAYEAYLQGRYFWNQFTPDALGQAIKFFKKAIELDPDYAQAYVGLADFYSWASIYGMLPTSITFAEVHDAAMKAVELDDSLAEAHAALGLYYSNSQRWVEAEREHRRGIELNPNFPLTHEWLSAILVGTGRFEEGRQEVITAELLDPLSLRPKVLTAFTISQTRDFTAALEKSNELISMDPNFWQGYLQAANVLVELGEFDRALEYARKGTELGGMSPLPAYIHSFAAAAAGEIAEARSIADQLVETSKQTYVSPFFVGMSLLGAGEVDHAFEFFRAAQAEKSAWMVWWGTEPKLDGIRSDERYWELLRESGNPIIDILERPKPTK